MESEKDNGLHKTTGDLRGETEGINGEKSEWDNVALDEIYLLIAQTVTRNGQFMLSPGMKQREANIAILSALSIMETKIKRLSK